MNKKTIGLFLITLLLMLVFPSCTTNSDAATQKWVFSDESLSKAEIPPQEIRVLDRFVPENGTVTIRDFGKIVWLYSIMEQFELHETLPLQAKKELLDGLFNNIPITDDPNIYRMTALGSYFKDGENLVLYSSLHTPSQAAPEGSQYILEIVANCLVSTEKATGKRKITVFNGAIMPNFNWFTNGVIFSMGSMVKASDLSDTAYYKQLENSDDNNSKINLSDCYTRDELESNDKAVTEILLPILEDPQANLGDKVAAALNLFQYSISLEDLPLSLEYLEKAQSLGRDMEEPSFRRVLDYEAPHMYELMKYMLES